MKNTPKSSVTEKQVDQSKAAAKQIAALEKEVKKLNTTVTQYKNKIDALTAKNNDLKATVAELKAKAKANAKAKK